MSPRSTCSRGGYSSLFLFSLFLQQAQGWSASEAGGRMAPVFAAMAIVAAQFGRLAKRYGQTRLMVTGYLLLGISMLAMTVFSPDTAYWMIAPAFTLLGIGMGLAVPATGAAAMQAAPRQRTGAASATMNALRQSGMTIGIALLGAVMVAGASGDMALRLAAAGMDDALALADSAVRSHALPEGLVMDPAAFKALLEAGFAHGFALAAGIAGLCGVAMALALAIMPRTGTAGPAAAAPDEN